MSKVREELDATAHGFYMSYQQCPHFDDVLDSVVLAEVQQMMEEYAAIRANAALEAAAAEMDELCDCGFGEKRNPKMYATGEHALNCRSYEAKELIRALKGKEV